MLVRQTSPTRRGATVVEVALLMSIFLMFLFGVLEYSRYLLMLHATTNAARDGGRYLVVNSSNQPSNWTVTQTTDSDYGSLPVFIIRGTVTNPATDKLGLTEYVQSQMGGVDGMIGGFTVETFPCDSSKIYGDPSATPQVLPVVQPKPAPQSGSPAWNNAVFGERIAVKVIGTYKPILPTFLWTSNMSSVKIVTVVGSEG